MGVKVIKISLLRREEVKQPVIKPCFPQQLYQVIHGVCGQVVLEEGCDEVQNGALGNHPVIHQRHQNLVRQNSDLHGEDTSSGCSTKNKQIGLAEHLLLDFELH